MRFGHLAIRPAVTDSAHDAIARALRQSTASSATDSVSRPRRVVSLPPPPARFVVVCSVAIPSTGNSFFVPATNQLISNQPTNEQDHATKQDKQDHES